MTLTYTTRPLTTPRMIRGCHLLAALLKRDRIPGMVILNQDVSLITRRFLFVILLIKRCIERQKSRKS